MTSTVSAEVPVSVKSEGVEYVAVVEPAMAGVMVGASSASEAKLVAALASAGSLPVATLLFVVGMAPGEWAVLETLIMTWLVMGKVAPADKSQ